MTFDEINKAIKSGKSKIDHLLISIDTGGIGGRYRCFVQTPTYTTMIQTPDFVDKEGPISFYERLTNELFEIYHKTKGDV